MNLGEFGEREAEKLLKKKGYKILARNYKITSGEIDIVASKKGVCAFVEVKVRSSLYAGRPSLSVTTIKQKRIISAAKNYIFKNKISDQPRFDVIEILVDLEAEKIREIVHIENAFC